MGDYKKIILFTFMILPLFTGSITVAGLQTAYGSVNGICGDTEVTGAEECDLGFGDNGAQGSCCSASCLFESAGTTCRAFVSSCDVTETCTGSSDACPVDGFAPGGTACDDFSDSICDNPDTCNSVGFCLENNEPNGSPCGDQGVECLEDDTCEEGVCEDNGFEPQGEACGDPSDTLCDNPNTCDGGGSCEDNFESNTTVCRVGSGDVCNPDETCTGSSAMCPDDVREAPGAPCSCTDGAGVCDVSGSCYSAPVDIKFGRDPNCIKNTNKGVIPVVILGSASFDVSDIDVSTLEIDDGANNGPVAPVKVSIKDVNGDSDGDLVLKFKTKDLFMAGLLTDGNVLIISGLFLDGTPFVGDDVIFLAGMSNCS